MNEPNIHQAADQLRSRFAVLKQRLAGAAAGEDEHCAEVVQAMDHLLTLLRDSERRDALVSSLIDIAGVLLLALDRDGRVAAINREGAEFLGYGERELIGENWFATCLPPEDRRLVREVFDRLVRGETPGVAFHENPVLCRGGERRLVHWHNNPWRDGRGQIIGTISSGRDVTEYRRTQTAVQDTEARLHAVVNTAVDAIITIDERGIIESVNPATEEMFGYSRDELVGQNIRMLMPAPYRQEHDGYIRRYLETGEKHIIGIGREVVGRRKDGSHFPIDLAVSEFSVGGHRMFTGMIRNISDRKELERKVLDIATEEQQRIGRDLHDSLGQELTGIAFLAGVLQKSLASQGHRKADDAMEVVDLTNQAIDHTRALVRGLCPVDLEADGLMIALQQLADDVKDLHSIRCDFDCPRPVLIDDHNIATQLYFIANEAVTNAVRHGKPKRIRIALRPMGERIRLSIADDGQGLPSEEGPGTGRGMHIMRYRTRMIGGALDITSHAEDGTRVTCTFTPARQGRERLDRDHAESSQTPER